MSTSWVRRYGYTIAIPPTKPYIYRLQTGGYLVRSPRTTRALPGASLAAALRVRDELLKAKNDGSLPLFSEFAASLLEARILKGDIESEGTIERWKECLTYYLFPSFGHIPVDQLTNAMIEDWHTQLATWFKTGKPDFKALKKDPKSKKLVSFAPATANGHLRVLRTICAAMTTRFKLDVNPCDGVSVFREKDAYGPENPNSLAPELLKRWLVVAKRDCPQHYALMVLGFVTGRRPGELRALKWTDINWATKVITVSKAHSRKTQIKGTKTGTITPVTVPDEVLDILVEHRENLGKTVYPSQSKLFRPEKMQESEFVFPSNTGGVRSRSSLDKAFLAISKKLGIKFRVTPRAMRRSFQDLARAAEVEGIVTRSISGHKTEKMQSHYSTVANKEQHAGLTRMLELVK